MRYYFIYLTLALFVSVFVLSNLSAFEYETGGHIRLYSSASFYKNNHLMTCSGIDNPYYDFSSNLRLKTSLFFNDKLNFNIHYEAGASVGDTRRGIGKLAPEYQSIFTLEKSDDTKFFDLTSYTDSNDKEYFHRLDRLYLKYSGESASISIGRQAISTGNGLLFNPMDILNPFAPSDVIKDYKTGTDMAIFQFSKGLISDGTIIYVPRKDENDDIDSKESSYAIKLKSFFEEIEAGLFYAKHFNDDIAGVSVSGFLGQAAWRTDVLWTQTDTESDYFSSIFNIDYSWVINNKNWYGLIEFYYSGIGEKDIKDALQKDALIKRLGRGELYNTATRYLGAKIQNEIHPLVNLYLTSIINLDDYSSLFQPGVKWSATEAIDILIGADLAFGGQNTEFIGINEPLTGKSTGMAQKFYIQGTYYF